MAIKMTLALFALSIIAVSAWVTWLGFLQVISGGVYETADPSIVKPRFWYEECSAVLDGFGGCLVAFDPISLPRTFMMSTIRLDRDREVIVFHEHRFSIRLNPGTKLLFSINATAPIDLKLVLVNRLDAEVYALRNGVEYFSQTILNASQITECHRLLNVQEKGLYIFAFHVAEPKPVVTVTFNAFYLHLSGRKETVNWPGESPS